MTPNEDISRVTTLSQDVAVIKSQLSDIRASQQSMNIKLDNMSAYTRTESDSKFASAQDVANLRWLIYAVVGGIVTFFFYVVQAKVL